MVTLLIFAMSHQTSLVFLLLTLAFVFAEIDLTVYSVLLARVLFSYLKLILHFTNNVEF